MIYGNMVGTNNGGIGKSFVIKDENGNEAVAVMVEEETEFTATANDIREGVIAATDSGVTEGTKFIPSYNTWEGYQIALAGKEIKITGIMDCDYTKLQVLICAFNTSASKSVATEKVSINSRVYEVNSSVELSTVTVDKDSSTINLGVTNESNGLLVIRYFMYKEIY